MEETLLMKKDSLWSSLQDEEIRQAMEFSQEYKGFIDQGKTERACFKEMVKLSEAQGFRSLDDPSGNSRSLKPGDKVYFTNKEKALVLAVMGSEPLENGISLLGTHIDSPRLDLKPVPFYEEKDLALAKTHYYGGVKKYQWVTIPLAMHGVVTKDNGEEIHLTIGEKEEDPVFMITDLLPHLSKDQMEKKMSEGITGEGLNVLLGNRRIKSEDEKDGVKKHLLHILHEQYGVKEEDFAFAEVQFVPAGKARDIGFDRSMIAAYGQDDRVCAYAALRAIFSVEAPTKTAMAVFVDKEEVGSQSNSGMESRFFQNTVEELLALRKEESYTAYGRTLTRTKALSGDVMSAFDPNYPDVLDPRNSCYLGKGVNISRYTGSRGKSGCNDANHEFLREVRRIFNEKGISWQMGELGKVDQGGGGTIAYIIGNHNGDVVDCGVPMLSMHAPYEVISKVDLYMTYRAYSEFLRQGE